MTRRRDALNFISAAGLSIPLNSILSIKGLAQDTSVPSSVPAKPKDDTLYSYQFDMPGDGSHGADDAMARMLSAVRDRIRRDHSLPGPPRGAVNIKFAPGTFKLTRHGALLDGRPEFAAQGLRVEGSGPYGQTRILFSPATQNTALALNDDCWSGVLFRDLDLIGTDPSADAFLMRSQRSVYSCEFERVRLYGKWNAGWHYSGTEKGANLGSEQWYRRCTAAYADFTQAMVWVDENASDQFVNYWFDNCALTPRGGHGLKFETGGSIYVHGGSHTWLNSRKSEGYMFHLTGAHSHGTCKLSVRDLRIEPKVSGKGKLLYCDWPIGNITFDNVQDDVNSYSRSSQPKGIEMVHVVSSKGSGASIAFRDCALSGKHVYERRGITAWQRPSRYAYSRCTFSEASKPSEFIDARVSSGATMGGIPVVSIEDCLNYEPAEDNQSGAEKLMNEMLNWRKSASCAPKRRAIRFSGPDGEGMPGPGQVLTLQLPLDAVICGTMLDCTAGADATCWIWDGHNHLISTLGGDRAVSDPMMYACNTEVRRSLFLTCNASMPPDAQLLIDYIA